MNKIRSAFFGLGEMRNSEGHAEFNWWHSRDHQPENLAIPGVFSATRWYADPTLAAARPPGDPAANRADYLFVYFMAEPVDQSIRDFSLIGWQTRSLSRMYMRFRMHTAGHFMLLGAWKAPGVGVSTEAVPYAPHKGVYLEMADLVDPSRKTDLVRWHEETRVPDMLRVKGVAGALLFWSRGGSVRSDLVNPPGRVVALYYLDAGPLEVAAEIKARADAWRASGRLPDMSAWVTPVLAGPFDPAPLGRWVGGAS